eukprot:CAMPEP_0195507364 /NCGR_PEP_ID=MMETSP0794_2-20130614/827_1 /TAXON_ID=515487 /ORGANISM="Stephanopyxis turris, Strain CCMP 815" /LENGTH=106 /DNA_ID=CAMNT_0040634021 /DNA_START=461 /DNA_END=781 /DNA_ORIENTATION=-
MAMHITDFKIGLAYASPPSSAKDIRNTSKNDMVHTLDSTPYMPIFKKANRFHENVRVANELEEIIHDLNVEAFVVTWPIESNGRMGKKCGKVLQVLDVLAAHARFF